MIGNTSIARIASVGIALLFFCAHDSIAADVPVPFEKLWSTALQTLALSGMSITSSDKQSGVIQFTGTFGDRSAHFDCPRAAGARIKGVSSGSLVLKPNVDGSTFVMVQAAGVEHRYRNHHLLMIKTGSVDFENPCRSTGRLESELVQRLAAS